jgi:hypothetical protein
LNTYWAEQGLVLHTEFRDGNVPAGYEQLRVLERALSLLPEGVRRYGYDPTRRAISMSCCVTVRKGDILGWDGLSLRSVAM